MERINTLLEKYFKGQTSLAEEIELKDYFRSEKVASGHESYMALFEVFEQELEAKSIEPLKKVIPIQHTVKRIWIKSFAYSGVAAAILLAFWIQRPQQADNYAVLLGKRIEDAEFAPKYAEKKLNKVNLILKSSMQPMQSLQTVRGTLKPMQKIGETREKLDEIENKIQFK